MSRELVDRLRNRGVCSIAQNSCRNDLACEQAADLIERQITIESAARFLFDLLDDIDTLGDIAKEDLRAYRSAVEVIQRRRFEVATVSNDGNSVIFLRSNAND